MASSHDFRQPPICKITVDNEEIIDLYPLLIEATVETSRQQAAVCTLVFDSVRLEDESWQIQDADIFVPWKKIKIEANFGDYTEEVMRGYIREIKTDTPEKMGKAKVFISCQDESILLDREHIRKVWSKEDETMTDSDIVSEVAADHFTVEAESGLTNKSLNQDSTHIQFLRDRALANGYECYVRAGTFYFQPSNLDEDPQFSIMVHKGAKTNCINFNAQHDGHKPDQIKLVRAADTGTEAEVETFTSDLSLLGETAATSENMGLEPFVWQMPRPLGNSLEEAKARAQAKANENAWKIIADGELDGSLYGHVLLTHKPVGVYGIGNTYGGLYYVDKVNHIFAQDGYRQSFRLLRNATGQNTEPETNDSLAAVR